MVTQAAFRQALGHFATGITVITTRDAAGEPRGFTATAFTSLSLEPPLVLVCVDPRSHSYAALLQENAAFTANILSHEQDGIAQLFASKRQDKFDHLSFADGALGVPVLADTLAHLECRVVARHAGGDHTIVVASVQYLSASNTNGLPLLHYRGQYASLAPDRCRRSVADEPAPVPAAEPDAPLAAPGTYGNETTQPEKGTTRNERLVVLPHPW